MAGLAAKAKVVKKVKKHGKKKFIRPSQKKSAKNGKQLFKQAPKVKVVAKPKKQTVTEPVYDENDEFLETDYDLTQYEGLTETEVGFDAVEEMEILDEQ